MFIVIIFLAILLVICAEMASYLIYGGFLKDKEIYQYIKNNEDKTDLNQFDLDILYIGENKYSYYAVKLPIYCSIFTRYYINNLGRIPYWSKSYKLLKQMHKKAKTEYYGRIS